MTRPTTRPTTRPARPVAAAVRTHRRRVAAAWAAAALALLLTGCGGSGPSVAPAPTASGTAPSAGSGGSGRQGFGRQPGVSGLIAEITGSTMQVQSSTEQTGVIFTASTPVTEQVPVTAAALRVGECVSARPARVAGAGGGTTPSRPATGSTRSTRPTRVAAATVTIISSAACPRIDGERPATPSTSRPSERPPATPGANARGGFGAGGFGGFSGFGATGTVASVGAGTFTVTESVGGRRSPTGGATDAPSPAAAAPRTIVVTWTASTTFEETTRATPAALKVGQCVTALGQADDTGTVTAGSLAVSPPAAGGGCTPDGHRG